MQVLRLPLVLLILTAATAAQDTEKALNLPATFSGKLPCADCPGIETVLTLRPDHLFFMTMNYLGRPAPPNTLMGRWDTGVQSKRIALTQANGRTDRYAIVDRDTLRMLDQHGKPIESKLPYELKRLANESIEAANFRWEGMYTYLADAPSVIECATRRRFNVVGGPGAVALERAYRNARSKPGEPLRVSFVGRLQPSKETEGPREILSVTRFLKAYPGKACVSTASGSLAGEWAFTSAGGMRIAADEKRPPYIGFKKDRATGFAGCNRFSGSYSQSGSELKFQQLISTRMACINDNYEQKVLDALNATTGFKLSGDELQLLGPFGTLATLKRGPKPNSPSAQPKIK